MSYTEKANEILKPLGLASHMETVRDSPHFFDLGHLYHSGDFKWYTPNWYRNDEKLKESDEIYRFSTSVYLHLPSGIRMEYHIHEYYFEGEEYKLGKLFVITADNKQLDILDADFEKKILVTSKGTIPFDQLKRHISETD